MAEFSVVMKHAKRMCAAYESRCDRCPFGQSDGCPFDFFGHHMKLFDFNEVEHIVMDWAEKHPEPRYPSWNEGWQQLFPTVTEAPCLHDFGVECDGDCTRCREDEMRADIAEKLGIKPIGGDSNV